METKLCKHCQTEIPKKAKVCPNCRKKQGGIGKWIIIAVIVVLILGSVGGGDDESTNTGNSNTTESQNTESKNTENQNNQDDTKENAEKENNVFKEGDTIEAGDLKFSVDKIETNYTDYDNQYGLHDLKDGMKYIKLSFTFENVGDSDSYVSIYDFDCYADGVLCEQYFMFDEDFINANLSAGRKVSYSIYFTVPKDAKEVELEYTKNIWTSEKIIIKVK